MGGSRPRRVVSGGGPVRYPRQQRCACLRRVHLPAPPHERVSDPHSPQHACAHGASLVTTIPARLAALTHSSGSWPVARARARSLYRDWYRAAPEIVSLYAVNFPPSAIRAKVRKEYERNLLVDDLQTVDILITKGRQEFQETMNCWKMESHIMRWFADSELPARPDTFLESFYLSRDDGKEVQPTA